MSGRDPTRPPPPEPLAVPVADSHCHLDLAIGFEGRDATPSDEGPESFPVTEALAAARAVGVTKIVQIGCDLVGARWAAQIALAHDDVWASVALHPNEAPRLAAAGELDAAFAEIEQLAALPQVRGVGETGLDYFRTGPDGRAVQQESFRRHIALSKAVGKPLVVHDRDAHDDVLRLLEEEGAPERVVFHCFSGDAAMARTCADRGYLASFAGTVTFRNAPALREAVALMPADQLLVETDAPFLTPDPYRGRPNGSYLVPVTLRAMAAARGADVDELAAAVMGTTERVFGPW